MNAALGNSTRRQFALAVLKKFIATIPEALKAALRVYGHRHPSKSAETSTDTELIVPLAKLDRERIVTTASSLKPRGETPLILSALEASGLNITLTGPKFRPELTTLPRMPVEQKVTIAPGRMTTFSFASEGDTPVVRRQVTGTHMATIPFPDDSAYRA